MNAMEARTREALHRVADGLLVSEHDLDRMEDDIMTLLEKKTQARVTAPRRRWDWVVAAVAAAALVVGGVALWQVNDDSPPAQPGGRLAPQPSQSLVPPELVGLWQAQPDSSWLWEFTAEGRLLLAQTVDGYLRGAGDVRGGDGALTVTIKRDGELYTMTEHSPTTTTGSDQGCPTTSIQFVGTRIQFVGPETVSLVDGCSADPADGLRLERVSPRDPAAPALKARFAADVPYPVREVAQLEGSWVHQETNRVLMATTPSGGEGLTYLVDDDGDGSVRPDQRGTLTVGADGSVRPQPDASSAGGCAPAFSKVISNAATLVTTSAPNGCFPAGSTQTWLRLN